MSENTIDQETLITAVTAGTEFACYDADSALRTRKCNAAQIVGYGMPANFRNLLDGGDFTTNPWQRGTSQAADITSTVTYMADRWFTKGGASSAINWSKQTDTGVTGFNNALRWQRKSGNPDTAKIYMGQVIESADSYRLQGQTVTLSFYVKCGANFLASSANFTVQVVYGTGTDDTAANMVAAAWSGQANAINGTVAPTTTQTQYTFTSAAVIPTTATQVGVLISYTPSGTAGANEWLQFMGFQLEVGGKFTTFEHRDVQVELEICQRYTWVINEPANNVLVAIGGTTAAANVQNFLFYTPVQMRAAPTLSVTTGGFKVAAGAAAATATISAGATHTVNQITVTAAVTQSIGQVAHLQGGGSTGSIVASAEY
jgi:hypothetical protein